MRSGRRPQTPIWRTLSLGLFASVEYPATGSSPNDVPHIVASSTDALRGLSYHGGTSLLIAQCIGSVIVCSATFIAAIVMFGVLNALSLLRVSNSGEVEGLDLDQHGASAYPELVISARSFASHRSNIAAIDERAESPILASN